jgi:hypothetical protein
MTKYVVELELDIVEGNPRKWNWYELLDLQDGESVYVSSKLVDEFVDND